MSILRRVGAGVACALLVSTLVLAAPPQINSPVLQSPARSSNVLRQSVHQVWDVSPQIQAASARARAAEARARAAARPLYNPELGLHAEDADERTRAASLGLTLDLSGKRSARAARSDAGSRIHQAELQQLRRDIASRWLKAWSATVLAGRQSDLGRQRLQLMQDFDRLAARRLKVGDISSPERDLAGLALGEAQAQQAQLRSAEAMARAELEGITGDTSLALPPLPDSLPSQTGLLQPVAVNALPELQVARAQEQRANADIDVARRARIPDPTVTLSGGTIQRGSVSDRVIGLSLTIPLPVLNSGRAETDAARAEADAALADVRAQQQLASARLQLSKSRFLALREAESAFRNSRASAWQERAHVLDRLWRAGEISTSIYLIQLKQSLDTALSGLELEGQAWQAWFDYLSGAGRLVDWSDGTEQDTPS